MAVLVQPPVSLDVELARVRRIFDAELASPHDFILGLTDHIQRYRGKMLRPTLLLLSAQAVGELQDDHYTLAAVVEMVHIATLLHDDVLDESRLRRQQPTLHALHGNEAAILTGDYLFSHAYHLCSSLQNQEAARMISAVAYRLCEGELLQVAARKNWELSREQYFEIITGKTAELVSLSCRLGAMWADASQDQIRRLAGYGLHCGLAFQIVDDVLDLVGNESTLGKNVGRDLDMGKITLPIILYLNQTDASSRLRMIGWLEDGAAAIPQIRQTLQRSDTFSQTLEVARHHVHLARQNLETFAPGPAIEALDELAEFILQRQA